MSATETPDSPTTLSLPLHWRGVLTGLPDPAWIKNEQGVFLACNEAFALLFGRRSAQVIGLTDHDLVPARASDYLAGDRQAITTGGRCDFEEWITGEDGLPRLFRTSKTPLIDGAGHLLGVLGIARDITADRDAAVRLHSSEQAFRALVDHSPDAVVRYDRNCRRIYANPTAARLLNLTPEHLYGRLPDQASTPLPSAQAFIALLQQVMRSGEEYSGETIYRNEYGKTCWGHLRIVPEYDRQGNIVSTLVVGRDIDELKSNEQRFRTLAENSPNIIIRYDLDLRHIYVNSAYERATRIPAERVLNQPPGPDNWIADTPLAEYVDRLREVIRTGEAAEPLLSWQLEADQPPVYHAMHVVAERGVTGEISGVLAIGHDISVLVQTEQQLEESYYQLSRLTAHRERVREDERRHIARELHDELGQILSSLRMDINLLNYQFTDLPALKEASAALLKSVDRCIYVTRNVASTLRSATIDMGITLALQALAAEFRSHTQIECQVHIDCEEISLDDEQTMSVFRITQEALTNVARHAGATKVHIRIGRDDNDDYELSISDNGRGFMPSLANRLSYGLIGIRERMLLIGGDVVIDSSPGQGTRIIARIPRNLGEPAP